MAANKEVILAGLTVMRGTNVKENVETNTKSTTCFDEVVPEGTDIVGNTLEIEKLGYDSMEDYIALARKLKSMLKNPDMITTYETIRFKGEEPYVIKKVYYDCILDSKDYEMKPEEKSVHSLKFITGECKEYVNGVEITAE